MPDKLNLGCGQYPKKGYVNVDVDPYAQKDVHHDLSVFPYPFDDDSFDLVEMDHVLEHLPDPKAVMAEIWRILRPGGRLLLRVPHFSRGFTHYDHKRGFDVSFPLYFDKKLPLGFTGTEFELVSTRLVWFAQPWLKKEMLSPVTYSLGRTLGVIFDFLGNLNVYMTSRLFCFWVGGFEEVNFEFQKKQH